MSIREGKEARSVIEEVYNSFQSLRDEDNLGRDILYGRHGTRLLADMKALGLPTCAASASPAIDFHAHNAQSELTESLEFRVEARKPRDVNKADILEMGAGYIWSKLDPSGLTLETMRRDVVTRPFTALWLGFKPFRLPKDPEADKGENQEYRESFFPLYAEVDNGRLTAFLEDGGKVTLAVRKMQKPFVRLVRDYDKKPARRRSLGTVWAEDFPELRMGFGLSEQDSGESLLSAKMDMWRLDDGEHICEYVSGVDGDRSLEYPVLISGREENEPLRNPFGAVSMSFACGFWNPDAEKPADRYEAFLRTLWLKGYDIDRLRSILASLSASIPSRILQLKASEILPQVEGKSKADIDNIFENVLVREHKLWTMVVGEAKQFDMPVPALLEKEIAEAKEEFNRMVPYHLPDDLTIRNTTASALASAVETRQRPYSLPKTSISRCVYETIQKCFQFYREQEATAIFNTPGVGADAEKLYGVSVAGRKHQPGKSFELSPATLGENADWYMLSVSHLDESPSARAARRLEAAERDANDTILEAEKLELNGVPNVALFKQQKQVEKWEEMWFDSGAAAALKTAMVHAQAVTGIPMPDLMSAFTPGGGAPAGNGAAPPNSMTENFKVQPPTSTNLQPTGVVG